MTTPTLIQPPRLVINPAHYPRGTRFWDVINHFRAASWRVEWKQFQLVATRLH